MSIANNQDQLYSSNLNQAVSRVAYSVRRKFLVAWRGYGRIAMDASEIPEGSKQPQQGVMMYNRV